MSNLTHTPTKLKLSRVEYVKFDNMTSINIKRVISMLWLGMAGLNRKVLKSGLNLATVFPAITLCIKALIFMFYASPLHSLSSNKIPYVKDAQ